MMKWNSAGFDAGTCFEKRRDHGFSDAIGIMNEEFLCFCIALIAKKADNVFSHISWKGQMRLSNKSRPTGVERKAFLFKAHCIKIRIARKSTKHGKITRRKRFIGIKHENPVSCCMGKSKIADC